LGILTAGLVVWIIYGILKVDWVILAGNGVGAALSATVLGCKVRTCDRPPEHAGTISGSGDCGPGGKTMTDEDTPSASEQLSDIKTAVSNGVTSGATKIRDAIDEGRKSGNSLDTLTRVVRQAPLAALVVAFLVGRASKRRW
jgi:hypothetical protein